MKQDDVLDRRNCMCIGGLGMYRKESRMSETPSLSSYINADSPSEAGKVGVKVSVRGKILHSIFDTLSSRCLQENYVSSW